VLGLWEGLIEGESDGEILEEIEGDKLGEIDCEGL